MREKCLKLYSITAQFTLQITLRSALLSATKACVAFRGRSTLPLFYGLPKGRLQGAENAVRVGPGDLSTVSPNTTGERRGRQLLSGFPMTPDGWDAHAVGSPSRGCRGDGRCTANARTAAPVTGCDLRKRLTRRLLSLSPC